VTARIRGNNTTATADFIFDGGRIDPDGNNQALGGKITTGAALDTTQVVMPNSAVNFGVDAQLIGDGSIVFRNANNGNLTTVTFSNPASVGSFTGNLLFGQAGNNNRAAIAAAFAYTTEGFSIELAEDDLPNAATVLLDRVLQFESVNLNGVNLASGIYDYDDLGNVGGQDYQRFFNDGGGTLYVGVDLPTSDPDDGAIPEPMTGLLGLAALGMLALRRR
jgi:MYXO-CTERM domain-containing protein